MRTGILEIPGDVKALPIEKLGELLASALYDIENGDDEEGVKWACMALRYDGMIQRALEGGQLQAFDPGTGEPSHALPGSVVDVEEFRDFLATKRRLGVQIRILTLEDEAQAAAPEPAAVGSGTQKKTTPAQEGDIVRRFNRGHGTSVRQLAQQFGVTRPVIDRVLRDAGVKK